MGNMVPFKTKNRYSTRITYGEYNREPDGLVWAHVGPIGEHTDACELQDAIELVVMAYNRRHGNLHHNIHKKQVSLRCDDAFKLLKEAAHP